MLKDIHTWDAAFCTNPVDIVTETLQISFSGTADASPHPSSNQDDEVNACKDTTVEEPGMIHTIVSHRPLKALQLTSNRWRMR